MSSDEYEDAAAPVPEPAALARLNAASYYEHAVAADDDDAAGIAGDASSGDDCSDGGGATLRSSHTARLARAGIAALLVSSGADTKLATSAVGVSDKGAAGFRARKFAEAAEAEACVATGRDFDAEGNDGDESDFDDDYSGASAGSSDDEVSVDDGTADGCDVMAMDEDSPFEMPLVAPATKRSADSAKKTATRAAAVASGWTLIPRDRSYAGGGVESSPVLMQPRVAPQPRADGGFVPVRPIQQQQQHQQQPRRDAAVAAALAAADGDGYDPLRPSYVVPGAAVAGASPLLGVAQAQAQTAATSLPPLLSTAAEPPSFGSLSCPACFFPLAAACSRGRSLHEFFAAAAENVRVGRWLPADDGGDIGAGASSLRVVLCSSCGAEVGAFDAAAPARRRFVFRGVIAEPPVVSKASQADASAASAAAAATASVAERATRKSWRAALR